MEEIDNNPDTGYSSCEDKAETEAMARYNIFSPPEQPRSGKAAGKYFQNNFSQLSQQRHQSQYPIKNLVQVTKTYQDQSPERRQRDRSSSTSRTGEVPGELSVAEGWHGPVLQRTRAVPVKGYGQLQVSTSTSPGQLQGAGRDQFFSRDGWTEIPIQRI